MISFTADEKAMPCHIESSSKHRHIIETEAPGRSRRRREPICGDDRLSSLPDATIVSIISLLPTDDGARTQALATRWRHLWRSAPLNLCDEDLHAHGLDRADIVSRILSSHPGPVRRFSVRRRSRGKNLDIDGWLRSPKLDDLRELELCYGFSPVAMPPAAFRFASSLCALTLSAGGSVFGGGEFVQFPSEDVDKFHFPHLKQLTIQCITIEEGSIHTLLAKCPVLESLVLSQNEGFHCLRISSPTLRSFAVSADCEELMETDRLKQVIVEDALLLERFIIRHPEEDGLLVRISGTPKLQVMGSLTYGITKLELGSTVFVEMMSVSLTTVVRTMKTLVVRLAPPTIDDAISLMKCFPCLENLYVVVFPNERARRTKLHDPRDYIECLDAHLKKFVLINYRGVKTDVEFAKFFLVNARVLQMMELATHHQSCDAKYLTKQRTMLDLKNRASQDVKFAISIHSYRDDEVHICHIHDLSVSDPFDPSLCSCKTFHFL
ncbi:hypothetical protein QOZ80_6BG0469680 [Eleusine coracana subsp. coracana]|nr:hypothetical protein QOZ80_6BG0469680 [Eleusine coracana subsp. coracana]